MTTEPQWVTKRAECTAQKVLDELRKVVQRDVDEMNATTNGGYLVGGEGDVLTVRTTRLPTPSRSPSWWLLRSFTSHATARSEGHRPSYRRTGEVPSIDSRAEFSVNPTADQGEVCYASGHARLPR